MSELADLVKRLITAGANPNDLAAELEDAVDRDLWGLWGDGEWRTNTVCSICGSSYAGICADPGVHVDVFDFDNPAFHKNQGGKGIPYLEWKRKGR